MQLLDYYLASSQSLKKIVLNESLEVLPKLTNSQLDILTIVFLIHETRNHGVNSVESLKNYLKKYFVPFLSNLTKNKAPYQHLQYTGCCGSVGLAEDNFSQMLINQYTGVFSRGFERNVFDSAINNEPGYESLLTPCINNSNLFQLNVTSEDNLKEQLIKIGKDESKLSQLTGLLNGYVMTAEQANQHIIRLVPEMENLLDVWKHSYMCVLIPTSVGIMLAYINLKRKADVHVDINIWIK